MMRRERWVVALIFTLIGSLTAATFSDVISNAFDENGRKTGYWVIDGSIKKMPGYGPDQIIEEGNYIANKKEGLWKRYFANGNIQSEITFIHNIPNGYYKTYFDNGNIEEEGNWVNNRNTGNFTRYYPNGMVAQEFRFTEGGLRDGVQKYYYENGQMELLVNIKKGKEDGKMVRYYPNGDIKEEVKFDEGSVKEGSRKKFIMNQPEEKVKETKVVPEIVSKPVEGAKEKPNLAVFNSTGTNTLYNKNKLISQKGYFKNGRLWNGKRYKYDDNGLLEAIEIYKKGKFIGYGVIDESMR